MISGNCHGGSGSFPAPTAHIYDSQSGKKYYNLIAGDSDIEDIWGKCSNTFPLCRFQAQIFQKRYLLVWAAERQAAVLYDLQAHQRLLSLGMLPNGELISRMSLSNDAANLIQINSDGSFYVHNIANKKIILSGRYEDDEIIVWTPDGRYDATAEGAHFARLKFPGRVGQYTFTQFDKHLRVPGLVGKVLGGKAIEGPGWGDVGVPPDLGASLAISENGRITGSASSNENVKTIDIYQDGLLSDSIGVEGAARNIAIDVARQPGARFVSALAVDANGLVSQPMGRDLGADVKGRTRVHLLAVGVDKYRYINELEFSASDADKLSRSLDKAALSGFVSGEKSVLRDDQATVLAILQQAQRLVEGAEKGDTIVFSFAGHGVRGPGGKFYLATINTKGNDIPGTSLAWDDLAAIFSKSKARIVVFLDACNSGAAGTSNSIYATNDQAVSGILAGIPSGLVVFSASRGRELSRELPRFGGLFTNAVVEVIANNRQRYDLNKNGRIEVSELYYGVKKQVVQLVEQIRKANPKDKDGPQTPWLARNQMVGDFTLF